MSTPTLTSSPTPPVGPVPNDLWYNTANGFLFIFYDDGNSRQWVVANPGNGGPGPQGVMGPVGPPMASRPVTTGSIIFMTTQDGEVVVMTGIATQVYLPTPVPFGFKVRVSEGLGVSATGNILVGAANGGTINGVTGNLSMDYGWETHGFRSLANDAWSMLP